MDTYSAPVPATGTAVEHFDVLIVGAGLSGIGAAWHLQDRCPTKSYAILEGREASGGTWDLFRYPGVRSDSDMYTLGYRFRPWKDAKAIADGPAILDYIREVASDHGIDARIRYQHRWCAPRGRRPTRNGPSRSSAGPNAIAGTLHLQLPVDVQRLLPHRVGLPAGVPRHRALQGPHCPSAEMDRRHRLCCQARGGDRQRRHRGDAGARDGRQRAPRTSPCCSARPPTWPMRPSKDPFATKMRRRLPLKLAYMVTRWKNVLLGMYFFQMCKRKPDKVKSLLLGGVAARSWDRTTTSIRISRRATIPGTSGFAWCRTRISSAPCGRARSRSSPTISRPSPRTASG